MATVSKAGKLDMLAARLENAQKRALIEAGMVVAQRATQKAPRKTGRLKRSITHGAPEKTGPFAWKVSVGTNLIYAAAQEFGATIDIPAITAKNKKALAFSWPAGPGHLKVTDKGGNLTDTVILKSVKAHKVTIPAHPYLRPALEESKPIIRALIIKNIVAAFE